MTSAEAQTPSRRGRLLVLACIVLLALNLRVTVSSLGVLIPEVRDHLGLSLTITGLLTTLPVLCFSIFGVATNGIARSVGVHRTALLSLVAITVGLLLRAIVTDSLIFIALTTLALAGCAIGNVILPPLVKLHFPDHIGSVSAMYGAAVMAGATLGSSVTVPVAGLLGGWRAGLGIWAGLSLLTFVVWTNLARHDVRAVMTEKSYGHLVTMRSPLAWVMAGFFGVQSAQAYAQFGWLPAILTDSGMSASRAGLMLGLVTAVGIPMTLALPRLMVVVGDRPVLPFAFGIASFVGWGGIWLWPTSFTVLWVVLLGFGGTAFTWILTMIGKKTVTHDGTGALSGFVQGVGYLFAAAGPFGVGFLHDATGSWDIPLVALAILALTIIILGALMWRWDSLEETIGRTAKQ